VIEDWTEVLAGAVGGVVGALAAGVIVSGALRRGGTRSGLALIVAALAGGLAGLAFVPLAGYVEAVALPVLAARLRRTQADRYAGLRTLARD
jgi:ammonia channel protein AmtB